MLLTGKRLSSYIAERYVDNEGESDSKKNMIKYIKSYLAKPVKQINRGKLKRIKVGNT